MLYFTLNLENNLGINGPFHTAFPNLPTALNLVILGLCILAAYLLGSFNTAVLVSKKMYSDDIRNYGSGNAGFTNVMRTYGKKAAIITFVGDAFKTILAIVIGWVFFGYTGGYITGLACMIGHVFPVFYHFKGGKGVVCFALTLFMLDWRIFLIELALFVAIVLITKYISLGSVLCAASAPIFLSRLGVPIMGQSGYHPGIIIILLIAMSALIIIKHIGNIKRIYKGTESKFKFKKSKPAEETEEPSEDSSKNAE